MTARRETSSGPERVAARPGAAILRTPPVRQEPRTLARPVARAAAAPPAPAALRQGAASPGAPAARSRERVPDPVSPDAAAEDLARDAELERARRTALESALREARERGLAEGRAAALEAAAEEARAARAAVAERLERLDALLEAVPAEVDRRIAAAEDDLVALCHAVICRILGEQLVTPGGVAHAVRQAIREAAGGARDAQLELHVNPADLRTLEADEALAAWLYERAHAAPGAVRWIADECVGPGGCVVRSEHGSLDARLDTQLAALRAVLLAPRAPADPEAGR